MAWKTLTTVSYIQVWNAGFGPAMKEYQNGFDLHKRIAHTPSLPHCSLSQGVSWIFTYAVCNGMLHPPQCTVSMRTRLCGSNVLRALLLLQISQKQDWILFPLTHMSALFLLRSVAPHVVNLLTQMDPSIADYEVTLIFRFSESATVLLGAYYAMNSW